MKRALPRHLHLAPLPASSVTSSATRRAARGGGRTPGGRCRSSPSPARGSTRIPLRPARLGSHRGAQAGDQADIRIARWAERLPLRSGRSVRPLQWIAVYCGRLVVVAGSWVLTSPDRGASARVTSGNSHKASVGREQRTRGGVGTTRDCRARLVGLHTPGDDGPDRGSVAPRAGIRFVQRDRASRLPSPLTLASPAARRLGMAVRDPRDAVRPCAPPLLQIAALHTGAVSGPGSRGEVAEHMQHPNGRCRRARCNSHGASSPRCRFGDERNGIAGAGGDARCSSSRPEMRVAHRRRRAAAVRRGRPRREDHQPSGRPTTSVTGSAIQYAVQRGTDRRDSRHNEYTRRSRSSIRSAPARRVERRRRLPRRPRRRRRAHASFANTGSWGRLRRPANVFGASRVLCRFPRSVLPGHAAPLRLRKRDVVRCAQVRAAALVGRQPSLTRCGWRS